MNKKVLSLIVPILLILFITSCARNQIEQPPATIMPIKPGNQAQFDNLIVFGDSLSDTASLKKTRKDEHDGLGNNFAIDSEGTEGAPITSSIDAKGMRRPMWPNYITGQLKLKAGETVYPERFTKEIRLNLQEDNINYAYAGALSGNNFVVANTTIPSLVGIDPTDNDCQIPGIQDNGDFCVPGLLKQVDLYLTKARNNVNPNTLFVLWVGFNDILNGFRSIDITNITDTPPFVNNAVVNIGQAVNELIAAGATPENIVVLTMPDLSITPAIMTIANSLPGNSLSSTTLKAASGLSRAFNARLALELAQRRFSGVKLFLLDRLIQDIMDNPVDFDIANVHNDCVRDMADPLCKAPHSKGFYLFFDSVHPSTQGQKVFAISLAHALALSSDRAKENNTLMLY